MKCGIVSLYVSSACIYVGKDYSFVIVSIIDIRLFEVFIILAIYLLYDYMDMAIDSLQLVSILIL